MSSTSPTDTKNGDTVAVNAARPDFIAPKFSGNIEELAKQYNEKKAEYDEIIKSANALVTERDDIRAMFDTITNRGLYKTTLDALLECTKKLHSQMDKLNSAMDELRSLAEAVSQYA